MSPLSDYLLYGSSRTEIVGANASAGFIACAVISGMLGCSREVRIVCAAAGFIIGGLAAAKHHDKSLHENEGQYVRREADPETGERSVVRLTEMDRNSFARNYGIVDCD